MNINHSFSSTSARRFAIVGILISFFILGTFVPFAYGEWNEESQVDDSSYESGGYDYGNEGSYDFGGGFSGNYGDGYGNSSSGGTSPGGFVDESPTGYSFGGIGVQPTGSKANPAPTDTLTGTNQQVNVNGETIAYNEDLRQWERLGAGGGGDDEAVNFGLQSAGGYTGDNHTYSCVLGLTGPTIFNNQMQQGSGNVTLVGFGLAPSSMSVTRNSTFIGTMTWASGFTDVNSIFLTPGTYTYTATGYVSFDAPVGSPNYCGGEDQRICGYSGVCKEWSRGDSESNPQCIAYWPAQTDTYTCSRTLTITEQTALAPEGETGPEGPSTPGDGTGDGGTGGGTPPNLSIDADPTAVRSGGNADVAWSANEVTSCSLSGPNVSVNETAVPPSTSLGGTVNTGALTEESTYTLSCDATDGSTPTATRTVHVIPKFNEF